MKQRLVTRLSISLDLPILLYTSQIQSWFEVLVRGKPSRRQLPGMRSDLSIGTKLNARPNSHHTFTGMANSPSDPVVARDR